MSYRLHRCITMMATGCSLKSSINIWQFYRSCYAHTRNNVDDIQVGVPDTPRTDDQEKLRQIVWRSRHLLIGKGNALPPVARGAVCDIDVGGIKPVAQRVRLVASKFREKLADLIKGLLSAKIIRWFRIWFALGEDIDQLW